MARFVLLDSGPLGLVIGRPGNPQVDACRAWLVQLETSAVDLVIPAIADYEVRRELLRLGATAKLRRLDALRVRFGCLDVKADAFARASKFWALLRRGGQPTAGDEGLDGDAILAGVAATLGGLGDVVTIATTNVRHLGRFPGIDAREWPTIT